MQDNRTKTVVFVWLLQVAVVGLTFWHDAGGFVSGPVSVLIVEESSEHSKLTAGQKDAIGWGEGSPREWLKTHGEHRPNGDFRLLDKDDKPDAIEAEWQPAFAAKGPTVPWLVVMRKDRVLLSEALPPDLETTMKTLRRFGGN